MKNCKNKLTSYTAIVLKDFSENYLFLIQRSVQAFYYDNTQATVHPFAVYYKSVDDEKKLLEKHYCVIGDNKEYIAYSVHAIQEEFIDASEADSLWIKDFIVINNYRLIKKNTNWKCLFIRVVQKNISVIKCLDETKIRI